MPTSGRRCRREDELRSILGLGILAVPRTGAATGRALGGRAATGLALTSGLAGSTPARRGRTVPFGGCACLPLGLLLALALGSGLSRRASQPPPCASRASSRLRFAAAWSRALRGCRACACCGLLTLALRGLVALALRCGPSRLRFAAACSRLRFAATSRARLAAASRSRLAAASSRFRFAACAAFSRRSASCAALRCRGFVCASAWSRPPRPPARWPARPASALLNHASVPRSTAPHAAASPYEPSAPPSVQCARRLVRPRQPRAPSP